MSQNNFSIRWHGRAGNGSVSAASFFGEALADQGKYIQVFPDFGAEKRGAPVEAFTRLSDQPILSHARIKNPDMVMILDSSLIDTEDVIKGLPENGQIFVNTSLKEDLFPEFAGSVYYIDAGKIALETIGKDIPNTAILGALIKIVDPSNWPKYHDYFEERLKNTFSLDMAAGNLKALQRGFDEVYEVD